MFTWILIIYDKLSKILDNKPSIIFFYGWYRLHQFEHPSGAPGSRSRQSIHGGRTETSVGGHARCHCRGNRWPWPFARSCIPRSCGTTGKSECCSPNSMCFIFFCFIYIFFNMQNYKLRSQYPWKECGNFNVYIQYEIFFFKIGYTNSSSLFYLKYIHMIIYKEILNYKPLLCYRYLWLDQQDVEKASASKRLDFPRESGVKLLLSRHYSPRLLSLRSSWDTSTPRMGNETYIHVLIYQAFCLLKTNFFFLYFSCNP